ncbi:uncharacterized protein LOC116298457 isoform X2 [Actinia tenebrosa]|uniref:Uncharacterized protein LOC116298457 isoform X2 n=1 Tax=Actinia tenebrosa TaxID=6105 RepID=A0A6P8I615_ACTTE|nr:uncharacterized protein LOC116298457 isoform X2 [Actinia tenebrosa]
MPAYLLLLSTLLSQGITIHSTEESVFPRGHLQPLGSHRDPDNSLIDELHDVPSAKDFWERYVKPSRAVVLRGAAKNSPAFTKWTDEYLAKHYGDLVVRLERKKEKSGAVPVGVKGIGLDTIGNFIKHYHQTNSYIVSELPTPMWHDFQVQPCLLCGSFRKRLVEVDLWMSGGGSSSILHKDAFNAINCLYNGTKEWKMIEYKYEDKIYKAWEPDREIGGFSRIDPLKVDLIKYPKVAEVPWSFVTINAGDCLFLPKSYYHQVTSYGTMNVALAILFSRFEGEENIDLSDCHGNKSYTPLSELELDWMFPGHGNLSMGNPDLEDVRTILMKSVEEGNPREFVFKTFKQMFPEKSDEWVGNKSEEIAAAVGLDKKKIITTEDIQNLNRDDLRKIALIVQPTDLSNTELHEHTYVNPTAVWEIVKRLLQEDGKLNKKKFIHFYKKILSKLSKDSDNQWINKEDVSSKLREALSPYFDNQREEYIPPGEMEPEENDAYGDEKDDELPLQPTHEEL